MGRVNRWVWALLITCAVAVSWAFPVPTGNEMIYLTLVEKVANPDFLPDDWTFGSGFAEHAAFDFVVAPSVNMLGPEAVAWAGRILGWLVLARLLIAIGLRLGAPPWATFVSSVIFLGINQSMGVGAEFIFSHFEAKLLAWPLFLGALAAAMDRRMSLAGLLAGLTFTFHSGVGLWAGGALVITSLLISETRRQTVRALPITIAAGLPGLILVGGSLLDSTMDPASAEFIALNRVPHHVDPFSFGERGPLLLVVMLAFNLLWSWQRRDRYVPKMLGIFQSILAVVVIGGIVARLVGSYEILLLQPFRVLPVLVPILFLLIFFGEAIVWWASRRAVGDPVKDRASVSLAAIGTLAVLGVFVLWNPLVRLVGDARANLEEWTREPTASEQALQWVANNTEEDAVLAAPPWMDEMFHLSRRSQMVSWGAVTFDRPQEWIERLEHSMSDITLLYDGSSTGELVEAFEEMPLETWLDASSRYGVTHLLSTARYRIEPIFSQGEWHVYDLRVEP